MGTEGEVLTTTPEYVCAVGLMGVKDDLVAEDLWPDRGCTISSVHEMTLFGVLRSKAVVG